MGRVGGRMALVLATAERGWSPWRPARSAPRSMPTSGRTRHLISLVANDACYLTGTSVFVDGDMTLHADFAQGG